jgi:hypothetical protein
VLAEERREGTDVAKNGNRINLLGMIPQGDGNLNNPYY